ncbi:MAG: hypothetical protein JO024_05685 [Candidatus Eremiobacteraeota bacterium]|nr:hypothetical protein [Candidatus Eremiobacteraeota bacterium]
MKQRAFIALVCMLCVAASSSAMPISIDIRDARLGDVIFMLAAQSGKSIIADTSARRERVTLRVRNASFDRILKLLAGTHNLRLMRDGNIYLLSANAPTAHAASATPNTMRPHELRLPAVVIPANPFDSAKRTPSVADATVDVSSISLRFVKPSVALDAVRDLLPAATFIPDDTHRGVTVVGSASAVNISSYLLENADSQRPRVLVDVRAIDVRIAEQEDTLAQELSDDPVAQSKNVPLYAFLKNTRSLEGDLRFLVDVGRAQSIASRRFVAPAGRHFDFLIGGPNGADVDIKPAPADPGIGMEIASRYNLPVKAGGATALLSRERTFSFRAQPNQSIIVGGFFKEVDPQTIAGAPRLEQLPALGPIFLKRRRSHIKDEICVVITPRLVGQGPGRARQHERGARSA